MKFMLTNRTIILHKISESLRCANRPAASALMLAVSKGHPVSALIALINEGQRCFGENRVQDAAMKFNGLRERFSDLRLHLIGPLQTNKVKAALDLFDVIETVDRPALVEALAAECSKRGKQPELYIQINTGEEPQKAGVLPKNLGNLLTVCRQAHLEISGLMCIPPIGEAASIHFAFLSELAQRHGLKKLSMGMSGDFEQALHQGSTEVRIGTALFGPRTDMTTGTCNQASAIPTPVVKSPTQ